MNSDRLANPFPANEDGAQYVLRGRYIMPAPNAQGAKRLSKRALRIIAVISCVVVVAAALMAFWLGSTDRYEVPNYNTLSGVIGQDYEKVLSQLDAQPDSVAEISPGIYRISDYCSYAGVGFDLVLYFEENEKLLCGFGYEAKYSDTPEKAAANLAAVMKKLDIFLYGTHMHEDGRCLRLDKRSLKKELEVSDAFRVYKTCDLTPIKIGATTAVTEYMEHLQNASFWEGNVAGFVTVPAAYYGDILLEYAPQGEQVAIVLQFMVQPRHSGLLDS